MRQPIGYADLNTRCFGCGRSNPAGMQLSFVETDEGVEAAYIVPESYEGAPGLAHGGILATLLDEVMCMTAYAKLGSPVVTGELTIRYERPVPVGEPVVVRGWITETKGRSAFIEGRIRLASQGPEDAAQARGRFFAQAHHAG